jgi:hypothetical protein
MSGVITTLLMVGLLVGGAYVLINPERRCTYLGICGAGAAGAPGAAGASDTGGGGGASSSGCCTCEKRDGTMKCKVNDDVIIDDPGQTSGWFDIYMPKELQNLPNAIEEAQKACDAGGECYEGADDSSDDNNNDNNNDDDNDNNGKSKSSKGKTISSGTRKSSKSTTAKTGSQGNPGANKKGVKNKNSSVTGSGQKISSAKIKKAWAGAAFLTGDGRYVYYPTTEVATSNYTTKYYTKYQLSRPSSPPYYVRGNKVYSL